MRILFALAALLALASCASDPAPRLARARDLYHQMGTTVTETHRVTCNADGSTNLVEDVVTRTYSSPIAGALRDAAGIAKKGAGL